ncbi:hypothetical protein [Streptomyces griseorubiginosus]
MTTPDDSAAPQEREPSVRRPVRVGWNDGLNTWPEGQIGRRISE